MAISCLSKAAHSPSFFLRHCKGTGFSHSDQQNQKKIQEKSTFVDVNQYLCTHTQKITILLCAHTVFEKEEFYVHEWDRWRISASFI